jgi:hypothetical protein
MNLTQGAKYRVTHKGSTGKVTRALRVFKWEESRFGSIRCWVFTSRVSRDVRATFDAETQTLSMSGRRLPAQELSIPYYDLISAERE